MDPLVVWLGVFWLVALLVSIGWLLSCCFCGLCCPRRLQRCLGVLALVLLLAAAIGTAIFTHRIDELWRGSKAVVHDGVVAARFAQRVAAFA